MDIVKLIGCFMLAYQGKTKAAADCFNSIFPELAVTAEDVEEIIENFKNLNRENATGIEDQCNNGKKSWYDKVEGTIGYFKSVMIRGGGWITLFPIILINTATDFPHFMCPGGCSMSSMTISNQ